MRSGSLLLYGRPRCTKLENGHGSDPCVLTDLRVQVPSWAFGCEDMAVCKGRPESELFHSIFNGRYANWIKQADCKSAAFGPCKFKSYSADYTLQSLNRRRSCLEDFRPVIPACGSESRLRRCMGMCASCAVVPARKHEGSDLSENTLRYVRRKEYASVAESEYAPG